MSGATTATYIAMAAMAAGTAVQAYGQVQEGKAARKAAEYDAANKQAQARDAINRGNIEQEQQRQKTEKLKGAQRAAMGASGVDVDSGSYGDVLLDTVTMGEKDAQTIRTNALRSAWGLENDAAITLFKGEAAEAAGKTRAAGTILTGFGQAYGMGTGWGRAGGAGAQNGGIDRVGGMGF